MRLLIICLFIICLSVSVFSQPLEIPEGAMCGECGMKVDKESPFIAEIITKDGKLFAFCDIGDMFAYFKKMKDKPSRLYVRDLHLKRWINARKAYYVKSEEFSTPMNCGIAGFEEKADGIKKGKTMTFDDLLKSLE